MDKLSKYKSIRDKNKTPEPFTGDDKHPDKLVFVVQKHRATALHYDFRLEVGGVMPSWAVPKGPSLDCGIRRLAMKTEDHPLDYRHFEGEIPQGEYGGGKVIIWDKGTYYPEVEFPMSNVKFPMSDKNKKKRLAIENKKEGERVIEEGIEKGEIKFFLNGKRLKGSYALVRTKGFPPGSSRDTWLLIKHKDEFAKAGFDAKDYVKSVVSDKELI